MATEDVTWDTQLDRALMNAAATLAEAPTPSCIEESCGLANAWLNVADSWTRRQDNELQFAKWITQSKVEEETIDVG